MPAGRGPTLTLLLLLGMPSVFYGDTGREIMSCFDVLGDRCPVSAICNYQGDRVVIAAGACFMRNDGRAARRPAGWPGPRAARRSAGPPGGGGGRGAGGRRRAARGAAGGGGGGRV